MSRQTNLLEIPQIPPAINRIFLPSQNTALWKINKAYLWPRSKGWMRALKASIQPAATKVTNMLYLSSRGRLLCLRQIPIFLRYLMLQFPFHWFGFSQHFLHRKGKSYHRRTRQYKVLSLRLLRLIPVVL